MDATIVTIHAPDGTELACHRWVPSAGEPAPKAVVQIAHGLAEHAGRYHRFAERLVAARYAVYAQDHRGHGATAAASGVRGVFAERGGWSIVVDDLQVVADQIRKEWPDLPVILFGHSMGSFLARSYAIRHGDDLTGLVLSATATDPGLLGKVGQLVATVESRVRGRSTPSPLLSTMFFGTYNRAFKPNRTDFDWLSRDQAEVDAYVADPDCGWVASAGLYHDVLQGLAEVNSDHAVARIPKGLPVGLFSGELDPVGGKAAVEKVADQLRRTGHQNVSVRIHDDARHEILNETNREQVTDDIIGWLDAHVS